MPPGTTRFDPAVHQGAEAYGKCAQSLVSAGFNIDKAKSRDCNFAPLASAYR